MFYVYIIRSCKDDNFYIGSTSDLKRRINEHNTGKVKSTKLRKPFELIYYEAFRHEDTARKREASLKLRGQSRAELLKRI